MAAGFLANRSRKALIFLAGIETRRNFMSQPVSSVALTLDRKPLVPGFSSYVYSGKCSSGTLCLFSSTNGLRNKCDGIAPSATSPRQKDAQIRKMAFVPVPSAKEWWTHKTSNKPPSIKVICACITGGSLLVKKSKIEKSHAGNSVAGKPLLRNPE